MPRNRSSCGPGSRRISTPAPSLLVGASSEASSAASAREPQRTKASCSRESSAHEPGRLAAPGLSRRVSVLSSKVPRPRKLSGLGKTGRWSLYHEHAPVASPLSVPFPTALTAPGVTSQINSLHLGSCLTVGFRGTQAKMGNVCLAHHRVFMRVK